MTTPDDYADIEARLSAATPGRWRLRIGAFSASGAVITDQATIAGWIRLDDAALIAHAPADLRRLLDRVRRVCAACEHPVLDHDDEGCMVAYTRVMAQCPCMAPRTDLGWTPTTTE